MVSRVYVEKKPGFDGEARALAAELRDIVGISGLTGVRLVNRYDVEGASEELFAACVPTVFSEPQSDTATYDLPDAPGAAVFAVEFLPGQFDQRADSASECIQLISQGERPDVRSAVVYYLEGNLTDADVEAVKRYVINPVEAREASLEPRDTLAMAFERPADVEVIEGFTAFSDDELACFIDERGLATDLADIQFCRAYFAEEGRDPSITEIKMIDTYWSDHCRHTTFGTVLNEVEIADANVQAAFDRYLELRHELGRDEKPVCLMDMGTIGAKWLKKEGILTGLDESEEINACTIKITVQVDGEAEIDGLNGRHYELTLDITPTEGNVEIRLMRTGGEYFAVRYNPATRIIECDRTRGGHKLGDENTGDTGAIMRAEVPGARRDLHLDIFVDTCSVEVFVNGGAATLSMLNYPKGGAQGISFAGRFAIDELNKWELA